MHLYLRGMWFGVALTAYARNKCIYKRLDCVLNTILFQSLTFISELSWPHDSSKWILYLLAVTCRWVAKHNDQRHAVYKYVLH